MRPPLDTAAADTPAFAGAAAAFASVAALVFLSRTSAPEIIPYVAVLCIGSAATLLLTFRSTRLSARAVLLIALALHGVALFGEAAFENDYFRFIWDGWRTLTAGSPYGVPPEDFFIDPNVPPALHRVLDGVNYPEYATIYGPAFEALFALAFLISGTNPLALRILFALANLALVALILRRASPQRAALYAWSPFALAEIVLHVHPDGVMALFLAGALLLASTRPALAGALLGVAAACKIVALAAWPLLLRLHPRASIAAALTLAAFYAPFVLQPTGAGFGTTAMFAETWRFNPMLFALVDALTPEHIARILCGVLGIALVLWLHWRARSAEETPLAAIFGAILLVAPVINPWYLLWLLPFAANTRAIWPYAATIALPLSYLTGLNLGDAARDPYALHPLAWWAEIAIICAALAYDLWRRNASRPIT